VISALTDETLLAALASPGGLAAFVAEVGRALDVWLIDVWSFDRERDAAVYEAVWRREGAGADDLAVVGTRVALDERPDLRLLADRGTLVERHIDDPDLPPDVAALMTRRGYRSSIDAPLVVSGEVIGVLGMVETRVVRRLAPGQHANLEHVCRLAALGVEAAMARRLSTEHADHLTALLESGHALAGALDRDATLTAFRALVARLLPGIDHQVDVWLRNEAGSFVRAAAADAAPAVDDAARIDSAGPRADSRPGSPQAGSPPDGLVLRALEHRRPTQARTAGVPTRLVVPLVVAGEPSGYIEIRGRRLRRLTPDELSVLQVLADYVAVAHEYARLGRSLGRQAAVDTVTGFFNRWYFYERLYSETARASRYKQPLSIVLVHIDRFDEFVADRGEVAGDAVLKAISRLLVASLRRKVDIACRHAAGEFGVLLPNTAPFKAGAVLVAERLRATIEGMEFRDEDHVPLGRFTLSLGVAGFPRHAEDAEELGTCAESALARARDLGGNRLQVFGAPPYEPGQDDAFGEDHAKAPIVEDPASPAALADDVLSPDWDDDLP
jgi:diguanylate cyclase (GGDEF)-like protein